MEVNITSSNTTDFTVSATSLTGIGADESKTFNVTFNYNSSDLGEKTTTITVTPTYDESAAKTIIVTATASSLDVWEDFSDGIPSTWYKENFWAISNGQARISYSGYYLRTPRLYAEANDEITFDVNIDQSSHTTYSLMAEYSTDCINWTQIAKYTSDTSGAYSGSMSFTAPTTSNYWLRFSGSHASIDNFSGWTVSDPSLDIVISASTIPATGTVGGDYTASVNVVSRGGVGETIAAELYFGNEKVAEQTNYAIGGNDNATFSFTYALTSEWTGDVYMKIIGDNLGTLETEKTSVTVSEPSIVLDEEGDDYVTSKPTCNNDVVKLKYSARPGWNTIVLPFYPASDNMSAIFGSDYTAYAISSYNEGLLTFTKYNYLTSSTPYLVYAPNAVEQPDGIYLKNVSIYSQNWTSSNLNKTPKDSDITFKGTFAPIAAPNMEGKYGVTKDGKIAKGGSSASIKAYHAYFELAEDSPVKNISLYVIDGGSTPTQIGLVQMAEGSDKSVYNLSGQRVQKAQKGIYIVNGKKVVVK